VDVAVISHLHLDHLGYVGYGGIWGLLEKQGIQFGKVVDRDAGTWIDRNKDLKCDSDTEISWHNAGTFSGTASKWLCYATDPAQKIYPIREIAKLCSTSQIRPPDTKAKVTVVTVDAIGAKSISGVSLSGDHTKDSLPPSENDYSVGITVEFGDFKYATMGDLDGDYATSGFGYTYNDIESVAARRVGSVDIYRANHHGSGHSSNQLFVSTMKPTVSLISCGLDNSYGHPDQVVLDRLLQSGDVYLTSLCNPERNYGKSKILNGHIVVRSKDGSTFTVSGPNGEVSYTSKKGKPSVTCP